MSDEPTRREDSNVEDLREQVGYLRHQLEEEREARRRVDTIIAQLARANEEQARTILMLVAPSESASGERDLAEGPAAPAKDRTEGGEGHEAGNSPPLPASVVYRRTVSYALVVLIGISVGAILVDAAIREVPYIDFWAYMAVALYLFPIGFGFAFGYLSVGTLTSRGGANALLVALPGLLLMIALGTTLLGYGGIFGIRLLYAIPVRAFDPEVVLIPACVSLIGAMFFLFSALVGHALHRQRNEDLARSAHALTPTQQALIGVLGAFITAVFGLIGILVQVFFAGGGTP